MGVYTWIRGCACICVRTCVHTGMCTGLKGSYNIGILTADAYMKAANLSSVAKNYKPNAISSVTAHHSAREAHEQLDPKMPCARE